MRLLKAAASKNAFYKTVLIPYNKCEPTYKPSFVEYGNLSWLHVAAQLQPPTMYVLTSSH